MVLLVTIERGEVSPMNAITAVSRAPFALPADPLERYSALKLMAGSYITLTSGDFTVSGVLTTVIAPAAGADHPAPVVVIDTGWERIAGPVLGGDCLT